MAGGLAAAPSASAATYTVNAVDDTSDAVCDAGHCSLREAIDAANASVGEFDLIAFDIAGPAPHTIGVGSSLPAITDPAAVDGTTEPDFNGVDPAVVLNGPGQGSGVTGLHLITSGARVQGLAIGGFAFGVLLDGAGSHSLGLNRIGTDATGSFAIPNATGVFIASTSASNVLAFNGEPNLISGNTVGLHIESDLNLVSENRIGTNAAGTASIPNTTGILLAGSSNAIGSGQNSMRPNVISGNATTGIRIEAGSGNVVDSNFIGTDATGFGALGNGAFGVEVVGSGSGNLVGGFVGSITPGNLIAFNGLAGVRVIEGGVARISQNSIHSNSGAASGLGIDIGGLGLTLNGDGAQNFPELTAAALTDTGLRVIGTLESPGTGSYNLEFFSSPECDESGHGEGRRYLGLIVVDANRTGRMPFDAELPVTVPGGQAVTATATGPAGVTSEFSRCITAGAPPPRPPSGPAPVPAPVLGSRVNVAPVSGVVRVRLPGGRFRVLAAGQQVPIGSVLDTTRGTVRLTSAADRRGATQKAKFRDGVFKTLQRKRAGAFTELKLTGKLQGCRKGAARTSARRRGRRLWGNGSGRFRSVGNRASAGVRGTNWLLEDRCDGSTLVQVRRGRVTVRDFGRRKTITLRAGQRYVAKPRGRR
jgi:CSLREA domain-containing protein